MRACGKHGQIYSIVCAVREICALSLHSRVSAPSSVSSVSLHTVSQEREEGKKINKILNQPLPGRLPHLTNTPATRFCSGTRFCRAGFINSSPLQARANTSHKRSVKGGGPTASIRWGRRSRRGGSSHFSHQAQFGSESAILGLPFTRALPRHVGAVVARSTVRAVRAIRAAVSGDTGLAAPILAERVVRVRASPSRRVSKALVGAQHRERRRRRQ